MEQIDFRGASINARGKHIGGALRQHAKKQGGITTLAEKSGVSRSTLNPLFSGQPVGLSGWIHFCVSYY